jgi:hypothetical protein
MALPDDDAGRDCLYIAACHLWHAGRKQGADATIAGWAAQWAPWCNRADLANLVERVEADPRKWTADSLAHELGITFAVRQALKLTTIGAIDLDKAGRKQRRNDRKAEKETQRRRKNGAVPRADYLAANSKSRDEPWVALNMSKSKYYRLGLHRLSPTPSISRISGETGPCTAKIGGSLVYTELSHVELASIVQRREPKATRRLLDDLTEDDVIDDGGVALARRLTKTGVDLGGVK